MKAKRQKHKAGKARSIAAGTAKKPKAKAGSESETSDITPTAEPPKKKTKLERPSSPGKLVEQTPLSTKPKSGEIRLSRGSQTTDAKANLKSKPTDKKKRKEVTSYFTPALVVSCR